ncbi:MAG TPA: hypothetical protein V6C65_01685, partial [Allocoleopsis sp.]
MTEATETQVITNWYSPLVQEMWQATLVCMDNYRDEVTKYDIPYLQKQGRPGDRALWLMRDYSSQMQLLDFEPSFFQNPDTLRAYHKQMLFRKELIQKERYDNCYLLTLDDPTVPTGQMQLLQPS